MNLTPKPLAWLKRLTIGPANRPRGRTGYDCMTAGWTEWNYVDAQGRSMTADEAKDRFGDQYWNRTNIAGERLTEHGWKLVRMNCDHLDWNFERHGRCMHKSAVRFLGPRAVAAQAGFYGCYALPRCFVGSIDQF